MDLRDDNGLLNNGRVWLQADDIDVKPTANGCGTTLRSIARFSLGRLDGAEQGVVESGDVWLKRGGASWQGDRLHG